MRLFKEELLQLVVKLIGLFHAEVVEPRLVTGERRLAHGFRKGLVVNLVQFKLEEQKLARQFRQRVRDVAIELRTRRIGGVTDIMELRKGTDTADQIGQGIIFADGARQICGR